MEIPCNYRFVGSPKELSKVESCLQGQTYKGDEKQRSMTIPSEDIKILISTSCCIHPNIPRKVPRGDAVQENSLPYLPTTCNDDKKLSNRPHAIRILSAS